MPSTPVIVYFRQDLRLRDNPALTAAARTNRSILPIYIIDTHFPKTWNTGSAQKVWLSQSLQAFKKEIPLVVLTGNPVKILTELVEKTCAKQVFWNRCYEPFARKRDLSIESAMEAMEVKVSTFNGSLLIEPWEVSTLQGKPYQVFSRFWKSCLEWIRPVSPLAAPEIDYFRYQEDSCVFEYRSRWANKLIKHWDWGEKAAHNRLNEFLQRGIKHYKITRDFPALESTSRISPYLHTGQISPRQIWDAVHNKKTDDSAYFQRELGWREFSYYLLWHFPTLPERPFVKKFEQFKWDNKKRLFLAWKKGRTGYPIVDAGMRELWETGWMHNRARMIAASFLTKDLFIDWRKGEEWFWDTLIDADLANNSASWQWVAGSGADAAPYFRIFNPVLQGEKFDPEGDYVKKWVPELKNIPKKWIHKPWEATEDQLALWGVCLGKNYPFPLVDHKEARSEALRRFQCLS